MTIYILAFLGGGLLECLLTEDSERGPYWALAFLLALAFKLGAFLSWYVRL